MYHSVAEDPLYLHSVSPTSFEGQMRFLAAMHNVISLDQLVDCWHGKIDLPDQSVVITFDDGWINTYTTAYPILTQYGLPATVFVLPDWVASQTETAGAKQKYMTWDQIREMSQNRISIGAHTISHRSLPALPMQEIRHELLASKEQIEQALGQPVRSFAYPFGSFRDINQDVARMVADSGYRCAVTSLCGNNRRGTDLYTLRRTEIEVVDGRFLFGKAISGALDGWIVFQFLRRMSQVWSSKRSASTLWRK